MQMYFSELFQEVQTISLFPLMARHNCKNNDYLETRTLWGGVWTKIEKTAHENIHSVSLFQYNKHVASRREPAVPTQPSQQLKSQIKKTISNSCYLVVGSGFTLSRISEATCYWRYLFVLCICM